MRRFVARRLGDVPEVDEIVQEAFFELIHANRLMQPIEHLAPWLMRVARNRVIDRFRSRAMERQVGERDPGRAGDDADGNERLLESLQVPAGGGPEADYANDVLADAIEAALSELPTEQREAFIAHELEGRSVRDIAAAQAVPLNTALSRKRAAVLHLRERLLMFHEEFDGV